jgi:hypothetical protein
MCNHHHHHHRRTHARRLGNLYYCYKPQFFWFELAILLRRLALALAISVVPLHTPWRASLIFVVLLFSLCLQFVLQARLPPISHLTTPLWCRHRIFHHHP